VPATDASLFDGADINRRRTPEVPHRIAALARPIAQFARKDGGFFFSAHERSRKNPADGRRRTSNRLQARAEAQASRSLDAGIRAVSRRLKGTLESQRGGTPSR